MLLAWISTFSWLYLPQAPILLYSTTGPLLAPSKVFANIAVTYCLGTNPSNILKAILTFCKCLLGSDHRNVARTRANIKLNNFLLTKSVYILLLRYSVFLYIHKAWRPPSTLYRAVLATLPVIAVPNPYCPIRRTKPRTKTRVTIIIV